MALGKDFFKNTFKIAGSTALAQGIGILTVPIFSRIFTPAIVGQYALFTSMVGILGVFGTGRYELALMLPKEDKKALGIAQGAFVIAIFWSLFLLLVFICCQDLLVRIGNFGTIKEFLLFVPLAILFTCWNRILLYWFNRKKIFGYNAWISLYNSAGTKIANISCGFLGFISAYALIIVNIAILIGEFIWRLKIFTKNTVFKLQPVSFVKKELIRYKKFPLVDIWNGLLDSGSLLIIPILLSMFFTDEDVGLYSQSLTLVQLPVALIASALGQVLFQKLSESKSTGNMSQVVVDTVVLLLTVGIPIFTIIYLFGEEIISWFLGKNWAMSGVYAELLAPWCCLKLCLSPLTFVFIVLEKQGIFLLFTIMIFISRACSIFIGGFQNDMYLSISLMGTFGTIINIIGLIIIMILVKPTKENWKKAINLTNIFNFK